MEAPLLTTSEQDVDVTIQGGSSSDDEHIVNMTTDEQTQHEAEGVQSCDSSAVVIVWNSIEFVVTLAQIVAVLIVLKLPKDKQIPQALFSWIISYTCASIATLPFLCCRLCGSSKSCFDEDGKTWAEKALEYFIVGLVIMFLWIILVDPTTLDNTIPFFWFWVALVAFSCIRYVLPKLKCALMCFLFPIAFICKQLVDFYEKIKGILGCEPIW